MGPLHQLPRWFKSCLVYFFFFLIDFPDVCRDTARICIVDVARDGIWPVDYALTVKHDLPPGSRTRLVIRSSVLNLL